MGWLAVDNNGDEYFYGEQPLRGNKVWYNTSNFYFRIPKGSVKKILGEEIGWFDSPIEISEKQEAELFREKRKEKLKGDWLDCPEEN